MTTEIKKACEILNSGGVVGMPTETVYGLAGSIQNKESIQNIFATKERPFFDPLIVHVSSVEQAKNYSTNWNEACDKIAEKFWPGPLTLILDKADSVDDLITSGLETVGIRFPSHPVALELINSLGHPVAAPSANKFKKISPTSKEHVTSEFPDLLVLEGGECEVGIESTIVRVLEDEIIIYRPGLLTSKDFKDCLGDNFKVSYQESPVAPGHLKHHYMPKKPLYFLTSSSEVPKGLSTISWEIPSDPTLAARELYSKLRQLDQSDAQALVVLIDNHYLNLESYRGVINRLIKASYLKSDLIKPEY